MPRQIPSLDGLRALAIALVLWQHAGILFGGLGLDLDGWFWRASRAGWWGVDLFFVLSGLLITRILLRHTGSLRAFWKRRAARTLPLLYIYLAVVAAYGFGGGFPVRDQSWLAYLTHTTNLHIAANDFGLPVFGMLWSLGVEEQFYGFWPLVIRGLRRWLVVACAALIVLAPLARFIVYNVSDCYAAFHVLPFCRVDTLAMGAMLALCIDDAQRWKWLVRVARVGVLPAILLLATVTLLALGPWPVGRFEEAWVVFGYSLMGLSCAILVVVVAAGDPVSRLLFANPIVGYVGRISYGIYLWHCLLALIVLSLPWEVDVGTRLATWLGLVVVVASVSWFGIERVWLSWGERTRALPVAAPSR